MAFDARITESEVLSLIYSVDNRSIWSPCTTLERLGVEWYPHTKHNRAAMKRVLKRLHSQGLIVRRPELHSHYTFKEEAYERDPLVAAQLDDAAGDASHRS
jgi:hypothetical protein